MVRLSRAFVGEEEIAELRKVFFESVHFGMGTHVAEFEQAIKDQIGAPEREVVAVNSGTSALHIALEALQFPKGSEIIVPTITFAASHAAIRMAGLEPVSCDVLFPSGHIDPEDVKRRITSQTVGIMPIAYAGTDFDRTQIYALAKEHNLRVIEDDAHAFGSLTANQKRFGAEGDIICFSFDGIKSVTCGEGGAVVTEDKTLADRMRLIRTLCIEADDRIYTQGESPLECNVRTQGFRYHMSNINAAIGLVQLRRLAATAKKKHDVWQSYEAARREFGLQERLTASQQPKSTDVMHIYPVVLPENTRRSDLRLALKAAGFESGVHYPPNHLHDLFKTDYSLPVGERLGRTLLSLPFHPAIETDQVFSLMKWLAEHLDTYVEPA